MCSTQTIVMPRCERNARQQIGRLLHLAFVEPAERFVCQQHFWAASRERGQARAFSILLHRARRHEHLDRKTGSEVIDMAAEKMELSTIRSSRGASSS